MKRLLGALLLLVASVNVFANIYYTIDNNREFPVILSESDANGTELNSYTYGDSYLPISRYDVQADQTYYYHDDGVKVLGVTDQTGTLVATYQYDAFGNVLVMEGPEARLEDLIFGGNRFDKSTGHYDARSRDYDPTIGRFTQPDTFQGYDARPITLHKYLYAFSDPVNFVDPSGEIGIGDISATLRINGSLSTASTTSGRIGISKVLQGAGREAFGIVGEEIIGFAKEALVMMLIAAKVANQGA